MQKIYIKGGIPGSNPLASILIVIVGAIVIGVSIVLGFFAFLAVSAIVLIAAAIMSIRVWWANRGSPPEVSKESAAPGEFIEGEFHVVKKPKNS